MSKFVELMKGQDRDETRRYTCGELEAAYSEKLTTAAYFRSHDLGVKNKDLVGVVADLETRAGRQVMSQIAKLAKAVESVSISGVDPNEISPADQTNGSIWVGFVPAAALSTLTTELTKSAEHSGKRGPVVLAAGKDGYRVSQDRGF